MSEEIITLENDPPPRQVLALLHHLPRYALSIGVLAAREPDPAVFSFSAPAAICRGKAQQASSPLTVSQSGAKESNRRKLGEGKIVRVEMAIIVVKVCRSTPLPFSAAEPATRSENGRSQVSGSRSWRASGLRAARPSAKQCESVEVGRGEELV